MSQIGTKYPEIFAALTEDFGPKVVRTRMVDGGKKQISYVTPRAVANRLDEVLGPEGWSASYSPAGGGAILCTLTITLPDGRTFTKADVGPPADDRNGDKTAVSGAFKRAAAMLGVGRYLYGEGSPRYRVDPAPVKPQARPEPAKNAPSRPRDDFADGKVKPGEGTFNGATRPVNGRVGDAVNGLKAHGQAGATAVAEGPRNSKEFYEYLQSLDPERSNGTISHIANWGARNGFPRLIKEWTDAQALRGADELAAYLELQAEGD